jgi:hypothetical protein
MAEPVLNHLARATSVTPAMLRLLCCAAVLALSSCSAAWQAAHRGQEALDRGDSVTALAEYADACKQSEDKDWCARAERLYLDVKADLLKQATPLCGVRGKERACLDIVNQARRVRDDPQLAVLADAAGGTWLANCRMLETPTPVDAIVRIRCIDAVTTDVNTPAYRQQAAAERLEAAKFVGAQAQRYATDGLVANALGLGTLAVCFSKPQRRFHWPGSDSSWSTGSRRPRPSRPTGSSRPPSSAETSSAPVTVGSGVHKGTRRWGCGPR